MPASDYAPLADETNPPFSRLTPAARVTRSGAITYRQDQDDEQGDLGELPRFTTQEKGKSRAGSWDVEQGYAVLDDTSNSYPPLSNEEEEERRIQANLSRLAARDQAERRARQSRLFGRPLSIRSESSPRDRRNGTLPTTAPTSGSSESLTTPKSPTNLLPPIHESHHSDDVTPSKPINPFDAPFERIHRSSNSLHADPNSPEPAFGYAGPQWRGGAGSGPQTQSETVAPHDARDPSRMRRVLPDKWWKALCAWGADLDGGHENQEDGGQAGRTNPFE